MASLIILQMEKYSKHLETLVAERTQELIAEQNKTTSLLYSEIHTLPTSIAMESSLMVCTILQVCCHVK